MNLGDELLKAMQIMINRKLRNYKADVTYRSVIKDVTPKGYIVLDRAGSERTVQCGIPGIELRIGQAVWVKEPMGRLNDLYICNVVGRTGNPARNRRR